MVEVAACEGHSHYLQDFDPQKDLDYDVASPVDGEVKAYGMFAAKRTAMGRYAENAQAGICVTAQASEHITVRGGTTRHGLKAQSSYTT